MFDKYTDIIYKGHYNNPIHITFDNIYIILTGEGGNRHIIVGDENGSIDLWIDTHTYGKHFAFLGTPIVNRNPSGKLVNRVWSLITQTTEKDGVFEKWTKKSLDEFFEKLYNYAKGGFWL